MHSTGIGRAWLVTFVCIVVRAVVHPPSAATPTAKVLLGGANTLSAAADSGVFSCGLTTMEAQGVSSTPDTPATVRVRLTHQPSA